MSQLSDIISFRKKLHQNAEISGCEINTAKLIFEELSKLDNIEIVKNVGGHGLIAIFKGEKPSKTILFRADIDALPIKETNTFSHKSLNPNISHKCGHDGHAAILVGFAKELNSTKLDQGTVILLFQASEETGEGAKLTLEHPIFEKYKPDFVFALHNLPSFPLNSIIVKDDSFTASVKSIQISFTGKTSHASEPENGTNPSFAIAELIEFCKEKENPNTKDSNFQLITPIYTQIGEKAYGTSAGYGETHFTLRTWNYNNINELTAIIVSKANELSLKHNLLVSFNYTDSFTTNNNDETANKIIRKAALDCKLEIIIRETPFKWGEDFGLFTQKYKGAMFGVGAGIDSPALHNSNYDFPDKIIETCINIYHKITPQIIKSINI